VLETTERRGFGLDLIKLGVPYGLGWPEKANFVKSGFQMSFWLRENLVAADAKIATNLPQSK
jgi:hypothetical protein